MTDVETELDLQPSDSPLKAYVLALCDLYEDMERKELLPDHIINAGNDNDLGTSGRSIGTVETL